MPNSDESWPDPARELMEEWNLAGEEESIHSLSRLPAGTPYEVPHGEERVLSGELEEEDSFPVGPTALYQAFTPMSDLTSFSRVHPRSDGPSIAGNAEGLDGYSKGGRNGRSAKIAREARHGLPRAGDEVGGFRLVVELGRVRSCASFSRKRSSSAGGWSP